MPDKQVLQSLSGEIEQCLYQHRPSYRKRLANILKKQSNGEPVESAYVRLQQDVDASRQVVANRLAMQVNYDYPPELPISQQREVIAKAVQQHQVVIVAGETGSGKTTQIPRICLEMGRGIAGRVGHTQPRRIAARSVAQRIADETKGELGQLVGYQVRHYDQVQPESRIKLMTDGILLAEIRSDRDLLQYDTLIIDEAHERSLNIDFILGYLRKLLVRRPELKLIITSATIATEKFSHHFYDAPVIEVSGRSYPVEVMYRPLYSDDPDEQDLQLKEAVLCAVDELARIDRGDVLIFLSGERDIRDMAEALRKHHPAGTEILPLFSRLSVAEQNKIFQAHNNRRIVLATNVAETSLTVPGIRYVIDPGLARISRYSYRSKVQRLPIEKISQASANQRKGRCGRVSAGICVRLYDEDDFLQRPEFTEPEIQRTNLASVILNMKILGLGDVEAFPFIDPPDRRFINDGYRLLFELGAVDSQRQLTKLGREMGRLSIDPRLARMILQARDEACLKEILIITCALEIQDPRERPLDAQQKADESHKEFIDENSDFRSLLNLWLFYHEQKRALSHNKLRKLCRQRFIASRRMQEWCELHAQISHQVKAMGLRPNSEDAADESVHRALLSGLVSHVGFNIEAREYQGSHGKRFMIFPGSGLFKKKPKWLMAAEIVETSQVYARTVATIKPEWVEQIASHLIKYSYSEPVWQARSGQVTAREKLTLYGLTLISQRKVNYGRIDPDVARQIFIRSALVQGDFRSRETFFKHNMDLLEQVKSMEDKSRRRDMMQDEQHLYDFYDQHIPAEVYSQPLFEKWWRQQKRKTPDLLNADIELLMSGQADSFDESLWPDQIVIKGLTIPLDYHFAPGETDDGVTAKIPLVMLNQLHANDFDWLVPGLLQEKLIQLIKTLPKSLRRNFVPAPDYANACVGAMLVTNGSLLEQFSHQLTRMSGVDILETAWQVDKVPIHLQMNFQIIDPDGKAIAQGRDLKSLQEQWQDKAKTLFASQANELPGEGFATRDHIKSWDFGDLPECREIDRNGVTLRSYPALVVKNGNISLRSMDQLEQAESETRQGLVYLFQSVYRKDVEYAQKNIPDIKQACLYYASLGQCEELKNHIVYLSVLRALKIEDDLIRSHEEFTTRSEQAQKSLMSVLNEVAALILEMLTLYHQINRRLSVNVSPAWIKSIADIRSQLTSLFHQDYLRTTPFEHLRHYPRYLKAIQLRLDKLDDNLARDVRLMNDVAVFWKPFQQYYPPQVSHEALKEKLETFRWMLEEYRVSLFAQELKTAVPVSAKRLRELWKLV